MDCCGGKQERNQSQARVKLYQKPLLIWFIDDFKRLLVLISQDLYQNGENKQQQKASVDDRTQRNSLESYRMFV